MLREAAVAWEQAAQLLLDAAENSAIDAEAGRFYNKQQRPDRYVAKWAQLAELLERYANTLAAKERSGVHEGWAKETEVALRQQIFMLSVLCNSS